jgi:competence protein ComEA
MLRVAALVGLLAGLPRALTAVEVKAVEINQASLTEVEAVTGIGTALAERIDEARRSGGFRDWPDLIARVRGLGPASAARLSAAGLRVDGRPYEPLRPPRPLPQQAPQ